MNISPHDRHVRAIAVSLSLMLFLSSPGSAADAAAKNAGAFDFNAKTVESFIGQQKSAITGPVGLSAAELRKRDFLYGFGNHFRLMGAMNPQRLRAQYAPKQKAVLAAMLDTRAYRDAPGIWPYFFRSSLIYVGLLKSPVVRVGFYNPIVDGWVMTDWSWRARKIKLAMVRVVSGEEVRGEDLRAAQQTPHFVRREGSVTRNLRNAVGIAGIAFAKAWPILGARPPALRRTADTDRSRAVVEARLIGALANLSTHYRTPQLTRASEALVKAVATGETGSLAPLTREIGAQALYRVAGLPSMFRKNIELIAQFPSTSGALMMFGMPMMSRWMMVAHYDAKADKEGRIDGIAFFEITPETMPAAGDSNAQ